MAKKFKLHPGAVANFYPVDGITISAGIIEFDDRFSDEQINKFRLKLEQGLKKSYSFNEASGFKLKMAEPTDADREAVKGQISSDLDVKEFGIYTFIAAESVKDSQSDVLTKPFLEWMGEKYKEGRVLADGHSWDHRVGKTFDYKVVPHEVHEGEFQLEVKAYVSPYQMTISGASAKKEIDAGIVDRVSVSFIAPVRYLEEDHKENKWGGDTWIYDAPPKESKADVFELSLVTMGAQRGARRKGEKGGNEKNPTFETIEIKESNPEGMETIKIKVSLWENEIEIPKTAKEFIERLDSELQDTKGKLQEYLDKEANEKAAKVTELVNLRVKIFGGETEKEKAKAEKLNLDEIADEIETLSKKFKAGQLKPGGEDKKPEKDWFL